MENQNKPVKWEKVYIFISSTFNDMHAERDYLVKRVFPKLSEWCEKRKLHMVDIDLRWGVTEADATQNKNVVNVCLNRIDQCRPFFICLLGQRYGTIAGPEIVSEDSMKNYPGLEDAINRGSSITELEILHSVISPFHSQETIEKEGYHRSEYAYFYFRDDSYLKDLPVEPWYLRKVYSDAAEKDERERNKLQTKRDELIQRIKHEKRPFHIYNATWAEGKTTPEIALPLQCPSGLEENRKGWRENWHKYAGVRVGGLDVEEDAPEAAKAREFNDKLTRGRLVDFRCDGEDLADVIQRDLVQAVEQRFPNHEEVDILDELQREIDQQEQFVFINSEGFIKRTGDFDELDDYVKSDSNRLFVLTAEAGMGKSMLLANWMNTYQGKIQNQPNSSIHFRFVGASDGSNTVYSLLRLLLREIKEVAGKLDDDIPDDPQKLRNALPGLLEQIGEHSKTVIVIDALNQLETGLSDLAWLSRQLPDNIKLIVSFKRGEEAAEELYGSLARDERVQLSEVKPFKDKADRRKLVAAYLDQYFKELDEQHIDTLIASPAAHNPLYLKVVLSEMRVFGVFARLEEKIRSDFGDTPESAFEGMLQRLETDPAYSPIEPGEALPLIFGLLAHSRHGLAVEELTSILLQARGQEDSSKNRQDAEDTVYFFLRQVRPFLARRGGRYDFFYESFKNAALNRYVAEEAVLPKRTSEGWHRLLADYFCSLPLWEVKGEVAEEVRPRRQLPNSRKVAEQPYHLIGAHDWERLEGTLTDLHFIEAKCAAGMTYDLISDYNAALDALPEAREERQKEREHERRLKKYTEDLIAYAKGEIPTLEIIPSVEPWSDEKIRQDTERIINNLNRLDRIRAFSQFINSESHGLVKFASHIGFVLQQAYNSANSGPVASAAERIINAGVDEVLLLKSLGNRPEYDTHPALLRTLEGHVGPITSVSISSDGKKAVSGSKDMTVRLWDLDTGQCLRIFEGHTKDVGCVSIIPDGKMAISGSFDNSLRLWDLESGDCLKIIHGYGDWFGSISITPDGKRAISEGEIGRKTMLRLWDIESGQCLKTLEGQEDPVNNIIITPDSKKAVCDSYKILKLWDLESGVCIRTFDHQNGWIRAVSITPDGRKAVSVSDDLTIRVWNLQNGECSKILKGQYGMNLTVSITPDGKIAFSGGSATLEYRGNLHLWDLESGGLIRTFKGHEDKVYSVSITPDGRKAVSGGDDNNLLIWSLEKGQHFKMLEEHSDHHLFKGINAIQITPDGKKVVTARSGEDILRLWDVQTGQCLNIFEGKTGLDVYSVSITPDGKKVVSGSFETLRLWGLESGECLRTLEGHTDCVASVSVTPDGKRAVSGSWDSNLRVWDLETGQCLMSFKLHDDGKDKTVRKAGYGSIKQIKITPDGRRAIIGGLMETLWLWDLETGICIHALKGHKDEVQNISITPDGKIAVSGSDDETLRVWELESGKCSRTLCGHSDTVNSVSITPDGKRAVSGGRDNTLRVWDLKSGECLRTLGGHTGVVRSVSVTPNGKRVVSGSDDKTLRAWELESGKCVNIYRAANSIKSISNVGVDGYFACSYYAAGSVDTPEVNFFMPRNLIVEPPCVTPIRIWLYGEVRHRLFGSREEKGRWEDEIKAVCRWCGQRFPVADEILEVIRGITRDANLSPCQSPCLELPDEAWEEPRLLSECPLCHKPLRFNPFIVDNSGKRPAAGKLFKIAGRLKRKHNQEG